MKRLIKAVLLDLNNVAEDYPSFAREIDAVVHRLATRIADHFGGARAAVVDAVSEYARATGIPYLPHYPGMWQYVSEKQTGRLLSYSEAEDVYGWYLEEYRQAIQIHDDFVPFLRVCRESGLRTGVVANGNARRIATFVEKFALHELLDTVVASGAIPFQKPAVEIFEIALKNICAAGNEVLFVGDRLDTDIVGANRAGVWSVRLLRGPSTDARPTDTEQVPDEVITSLRELWSKPLLSREPQVDTAVIMSGGRGSRMGELTDHCQKCLLPSNGEPILTKVVEPLAAAGIRVFHFLVQYRADDVVAFVTKRFPGLDARFHHVVSQETGAGVRELLQHLPRHFVYSHGNIAVPQNVIHRLLKASCRQPDRSWFAATPRADIAPTHPVFSVNQDEVLAIRRVASGDGQGRTLYSMGIGVICKNSIDASNGASHTTEQMWERSPEQLGIVEYAGDWWHLESPADLERYKQNMGRSFYA